MPTHPSSSPALSHQLASALAARESLIAKLHEETTDCYRLFHGTVEGQDGLTVDRYGDLLLVQSFHTALDPVDLNELETFYRAHFPQHTVIYNDRSAAHSRIANVLDAEQAALAMVPREVSEMGVKYRIQARHDGQDPWLFLDARAVRRLLIQEADNKSVLNLFAYTCSAGTAAAVGGAGFVMNVDFADSALKVGRENARLNALTRRPRFINSDFFAAIRQLAGIGQPKRVRGRPMPPFPELKPTQFDIVLLDPPRYAKSAFGVVDVVHDYPALFKPALLTTAEGGTLICCNNAAKADRDAWIDQLERSARKAGRPIKAVEWITPEADFPSFDDQPPLKIAVLRV